MEFLAFHYGNLYTILASECLYLRKMSKALKVPLRHPLLVTSRDKID